MCWQRQIKTFGSTYSKSGYDGTIIYLILGPTWSEESCEVFLGLVLGHCGMQVCSAEGLDAYFHQS